MAIRMLRRDASFLVIRFLRPLILNFAGRFVSAPVTCCCSIKAPSFRCAARVPCSSLLSGIFQITNRSPPKNKSNSSKNNHFLDLFLSYLYAPHLKSGAGFFRGEICPLILVGVPPLFFIPPGTLPLSDCFPSTLPYSRNTQPLFSISLFLYFQYLDMVYFLCRRRGITLVRYGVNFHFEMPY